MAKYTAEEMSDRHEIQELIHNWIIYSDSGDWENFRTVWHDEGVMRATWWQGSGEEFVKARMKAFETDFFITHFQGGTTIELAGNRAVTQTKMEIINRGPVHGVLCDVVCNGRFYDFLEKRDSIWGIVARRPIYEKDRIDTVDPAAELTLDPDVLAKFPAGYCHLAYMQTDMGFKVKTDMPGLKGPIVEALYADGKKWLNGEALS